MTNQLETAKEWLSDLNKIIDITDNECTKQKRDVLEWLGESVEKLKDEVASLEMTLESAASVKEEMEQLQEFYDYLANMHGNGLEVANYHLNGTTEPFDTFFDEAEELMKGESQ